MHSKMKTKTLLKGLFGISSLLLIWFFSISTFAYNDVNDYQSIREKSRENYLKQLDQKLKENPALHFLNQTFSRLMRSSWETQYFDILWGDNKQSFEFYNVVHLFQGNTFIVSNDNSSDDDINFAVYLLNRDWSRWSLVWGWYNDLKPGKSKKVGFRSKYSERRDFIVVIENDWYFFQKDKHVSWSIQALGY